MLLYLDNLLRDVLGGFCSSRSLLQIIWCFPVELDQPIDWPGTTPIFVTQVVHWFRTEEYQKFSFPDFFCSSPSRPQIIFSELYLHLEELVLLSFQGICEDSVFQTACFLCHVEITTHFRNHDPFFLSTMNVQHLRKTHHLVAVSRNFRQKTFAKDLSLLMMLAAVDYRLLLFAERQRQRKDLHLLLAPA